MIAIFVIVVLVIVVIDAGAIASLAVQQSASVKALDGGKYRLRLRPTGVPWVSWGNWDMSWWAASLQWLRRHRLHDRSWTVTVSKRGVFNVGDPPILSERFGTRTEAASRMEEVALLLEQGRLQVEGSG